MESRLDGSCCSIPRIKSRASVFFTPGEYFTDVGFALGTYLGLTNRALRIRLFGSSLS